MYFYFVQVQYNPRRLVGYGLTDGEQLERFWAFLRMFAKITKEMTPAHRMDMLAIATAHFIQKKQNKMGTNILLVVFCSQIIKIIYNAILYPNHFILESYLIHKMQRAELLIQSSKDKLKEIMEDVEGQ